MILAIFLFILALVLVFPIVFCLKISDNSFGMAGAIVLIIISCCCFFASISWIAYNYDKVLCPYCPKHECGKTYDVLLCSHLHLPKIVLQ